MTNKTDPRQLESYLEQKETYAGSLEPDVERLVDSLQEWQHETELQPRAGFVNELAQQLNEQERPDPEAHTLWPRLWNLLLEGSLRAAAVVAIIALLAVWLLSLSGQPQPPEVTLPAANAADASSDRGMDVLEQLSSRPFTFDETKTSRPGTIIGQALAVAVPLLGALILWLLLGSVILGVLAIVMQRRRASKAAALLALLLLLLASGSYAANDMSWRLLPALIRGYQYDPAVDTPDSRLIQERPEVLIQRQLDALVGRTGASPLRSDSPLGSYQIDLVRVAGWTRRWVTAVVDATLTFEDGSTTEVSLSVPAGAGTNLLFPFLGEVNRAAYGWYAGGSSLYHLFQTPAPATPLQRENPPVALEPIREIDAESISEQVDPRTSFVSPSSVSARGDLLADVDLRQGERNVGNAILYYPASGRARMLAETSLSSRATFFPNGRGLAYVRGSGEHNLELVVRESQDNEQRLTSVDWMTHHWVGNGQIAFSRDDMAYLYDLRTGAEHLLAPLTPSELTLSNYFRVSPDGRQIAYVDFEQRLWVTQIGSGRREHIGWDVTEIGWGSGIAWRPDSAQLAYTAVNDVTLPGQAELWLYDTVSGQNRLLARAGVDFLNRGSDSARFGNPCWVDADVVLFTAELFPGNEVRLLASRSNGSELWDVTPEGETLAFPDSHCENSYIAINTSRTVVTVYAVSPREPGSGVNLSLADYPPRETPYFIQDNNFWLVHNLAGELFAFVPTSPEYREAVTVEECAFHWTDGVSRFIDPCSGDEWELDGTLNLEHSTELWSNRDLDQYAVTVEGSMITVHLDQVVRGTVRGE